MEAFAGVRLELNVMRRADGEQPADSGIKEGKDEHVCCQWESSMCNVGIQESLLQDVALLFKEYGDAKPPFCPQVKDLTSFLHNFLKFGNSEYQDCSFFYTGSCTYSSTPSIQALI